MTVEIGMSRSELSSSNNDHKDRFLFPKEKEAGHVQNGVMTRVCDKRPSQISLKRRDR
jgi:hypothetical protein